MGNTFYLGFEPTLMEWLQNFMNPVIKALFVVITNFGESSVLIIILGFLYWSYDKEYGKFVGTNMVIGVVACAMVKNAVCRIRPYMVHDNVQCFKRPDASADLYDVSGQGYSFPSGHSTNAALAYGSLSLYKPEVKWLRVCAIVVPLLVGFSRIMVGAHYPTDVLAGLVFGTIILFVVSYFQKKLERKWILHIVIVALSLPGVFYCNTDEYFTGLGIMIGFFAAINFEEKVVKFENPTTWPQRIIRLVLGIMIYSLLNMVLKKILPGGEDVLEHCMRVLRYAIDLFVIIGIYPMVFKVMDRR